MDDPFVSCPYNKNHRVPRSRLQRHIVKCQEKNPNWLVCPYNATHRFDRDAMKIHVTECPSKWATFPEEKLCTNVKAMITTPKVRNNQLPEPDNENWDN